MTEDRGGWIKLYRSIQGHWIYQDPLLLKIWIDMIFMANLEPKKFPTRIGIIDIDRGQFFTSIRHLAIRWNIDKTTVTNKLKILQSEGMIYVDSKTGCGTLITIRNYDDYQVFQTDLQTLPRTKNRTKNRTENRTECGLKIDTTKEHKEHIKNGKNMGLAPGDPDYFEEV